MRFIDLLALVNEQGGCPVRFTSLTDTIVTSPTTTVEEITTTPINYPTPNGQAYFKLIEGRTSPYDREFDKAEIRFCSSLLADKANMKFVLTKELMHVFDTSDERASSPELFKNLLLESEQAPGPIEASSMYATEHFTKWMAILVLCPPLLRDKFRHQLQAASITVQDIAIELVLPVYIVEEIMGEQYDLVAKAMRQAAA